MLVIHATKLAGDWLRQFLPHHLQAGAEALPGAQNAGEEVERFGELRIEQFPATFPARGNQEAGHDPADDHSREAGDRVAGEQAGNQPRQGRDSDEHDQEAGQRKPRHSLRKPVLHPSNRPAIGQGPREAGVLLLKQQRSC